MLIETLLSTGGLKVTEFLTFGARVLRRPPDAGLATTCFHFAPVRIRLARTAGTPKQGGDRQRSVMIMVKCGESGKLSPTSLLAWEGGRCRAPRWVADAVFRLAGPFSPFETRVLGGELRYPIPNGSKGICAKAPFGSKISRPGGTFFFEELQEDDFSIPLRSKIDFQSLFLFEIMFVPSHLALCMRQK